MMWQKSLYCKFCHPALSTGRLIERFFTYVLLTEWFSVLFLSTVKIGQNCSKKVNHWEKSEPLKMGLRESDLFTFFWPENPESKHCVHALEILNVGINDRTDGCHQVPFFSFAYWSQKLSIYIQHKKIINSYTYMKIK